MVLPATLAVATFASAGACNGPGQEQYCADIEAVADCEAAAGCGWNESFDECVNTCHELEAQADCEAIERCAWYPDGVPGAETGGETGEARGACGEPFT